MEVAFSSSFRRAFKKIVLNDQNLESKFWEKMRVFLSDPYDPRLKTHKLSGKLKELWSFRLDYDVRIIFFFEGKDRAIFVDIGSHEEVY